MTRGRLIAVLAAAAALAAALIVASVVGASETSTAAAPSAPARVYAGIPQDGNALGRPGAPVTLVEYADLQCPYCAEWASRTLPVVVAEYVRAGKVRIVFRGLAFLGPDSEKALRTVLAAGRHDRLWDVLDGLYRRQAGENSGWVTDELLDDVAAEAGLGGGALRAEGAEAWVDTERSRNERAAQRAGVPGTPAFELGRTGGPLRLVELRSLGPEGLVPAIDALLAAR